MVKYYYLFYYRISWYLQKIGHRIELGSNQNISNIRINKQYNQFVII